MNIEKMLNDLKAEFKLTNFTIEETVNHIIVRHDNEYYGLHATIDERVEFMKKVEEICNTCKNFVIFYSNGIAKESTAEELIAKI